MAVAASRWVSDRFGSKADMGQSGARLLRYCFEHGCGSGPDTLDTPPSQENVLKKKKPNIAEQKMRTSKANHNLTEKETLQDRRQQELGRDTKPGGINSDKSRQPGTR
jgi:hypothetical protein